MASERSFWAYDHTISITLDDKGKQISITCTSKPEMNVFLKSIDLNVHDDDLRKQLYKTIKKDKNFYS